MTVNDGKKIVVMVSIKCKITTIEFCLINIMWDFAHAKEILASCLPLAPIILNGLQWFSANHLRCQTPK